MLIVISPAKRLDFESPVPEREFSTPAFVAESAKLVKQMRGL